ncbi:nucleotidyltransferase domain-containing protein [Seleniivibrio woodruffii]|uniref:nucleotidyltransferase domain-containing protein n=1 Tax=Seleniivibrio woodruffii TaxID=1078050 RepID=UPI002409BD9C|nr:nucleotidyltransferase [Seleniivibrio woodruffii]
MPNESRENIIKKMIEQLELPGHAIEKAINRYEDIGEWLSREESIVAEFEPHIFPQGSFRLGTAVRPLDASDEYDIDLSCKLCSGITKENMSQKDFKELVGEELEKYRIARGIRNKLDAKRRCWRLEYLDDISFHMDIVPCIPATEDARTAYMTSLRLSGLDEMFSLDASKSTVNITDNQKPTYNVISDDWHISNPEGYAKWFESRMTPSKNITLLSKAQVDDVPIYKRKNPLQIVIQLLKRHRDQWSVANPDSKPISVVITTIAAKAYNGEKDIVTALENIVNTMERYVNKARPKVPNPVDPNEDFADKWDNPEYKLLNLEANFYSWLACVKRDFRQIISNNNVVALSDSLEEHFSVKIQENEIKTILGASAITQSYSKPGYVIKDSAPKPWCRR